MNTSKLFHILLGAMLAAMSVQASPGFGLTRRSIFVSETCKDLVVGATQKKAGNVCVTISGGTATVTYTMTEPGTLTGVHVYLDTVAPTNRAPGLFPYQSPNKGCTIAADGRTATCTIPVKSEWEACNKVLYIATHADITSTTVGGTGWGAGTCFDSAGGNCAKYWTFETSCGCPVEYVYDPIVSTTECVTVTTITNTLETTVTPSPSSTTQSCDDPNGSSTITIHTTTTTSIAFTCPATLTCPAPTP
ncbi:hypothetical protein B0T10DRAFT_587940 [Thelonectria olida]|uniref:Uncharacterized protein n=1 Tax=Thelonectria olida TaxID=1576542 RepID=A0A9P9AID0_9HYPO|nr:hypothetical protein B0T10DRAFT_587940 [Thelonectria olida]